MYFFYIFHKIKTKNAHYSYFECIAKLKYFEIKQLCLKIF